MMPKVHFTPANVSIEVDAGTKLLAAATRSKVGIRFGCAALRCGTCGVKVSGTGELTPLAADEIAMLERLRLPTSGEVRMACRTKIMSGDVTIDLAFQDSYSPDTSHEYE